MRKGQTKERNETGSPRKEIPRLKEKRKIDGRVKSQTPGLETRQKEVGTKSTVPVTTTVCGLVGSTFGGPGISGTERLLVNQKLLPSRSSCGGRKVRLSGRGSGVNNGV